jgi:hypothetical protein
VVRVLEGVAQAPAVGAHKQVPGVAGQALRVVRQAPAAEMRVLAAVEQAPGVAAQVLGVVRQAPTTEMRVPQNALVPAAVQMGMVSIALQEENLPVSQRVQQQGQAVLQA